ncbi:type II toxin-antitoxin system RelE/ParE family toxin [Flavobacterium silvaticum]|uniref:Type II toxin-antitoxin system RelE/ParE family toxin n=1 Tax=Flavobacterium silvaticum TaxID=1852020 RepID=A0A972JHQ0_9FLAO|nr:type II toxin-antitoxin system RelE/ParE family toxin [Flavobacterium silvaticum]NMH26472.1 type II toxin-antitoxin system RelE/ParE family toxin [Flavobacterium silvaticum]
MELKIYWTNFAKQELQIIFDYHKENVSLKIARNLVSGIVKESKKLSKQPLIGQDEFLLKEFHLDYKYLVYKNYKIVYLFDKNRNRIEVHDVFDTRQNPVKIGRKK